MYGDDAPSPANAPSYETKQDDVRRSAPVAALLIEFSARSHAPKSSTTVAPRVTTAQRFDNKIDELRTKRAGVVRDYASITQLRHASVTRTSKSDSLSSISPTSSPRELSVSSKALNNNNSNNVSNTINTTSNSHYFHKSSSNNHVHGDYASPRAQRRSPKAKSSSSSPSTSTTPAIYGDTSTELSEIKQSVQRLRAQRAHVEQLRHHNERLELLVTEQGKENEELRRELDSLRGVETENVGLLQSFKLLEERLRSLEDICHEKRQQLKATHDRLMQVETQRDHLEAAMQDTEHDHEQRIASFRTKQTTLVDRIRQLERDQDAFVDKQQRLEEHWRDKVHHAQQDAITEQQDCRHELEVSLKENKKLASEVSELETQVQKLLATTVRQTTMIEDCDRALSEAKAQQKTAKASYHDQLELNGRLNEHIQHLETQLSTLQIGGESDRNAYEKRILEIESKLTKRKDRIEIMQVALLEKDKQLQASQREINSRDRSSEHIQEVREALLQAVVGQTWGGLEMLWAHEIVAEQIAECRPEAPREDIAERDLGAANRTGGESNFHNFAMI